MKLNNLRKIREDNDLTQEYVAAKLQVKLLVLESVAPFALNLAVKVTTSFLVTA